MKSILTIISVQAGFRQYRAMSGAKFNAAEKNSNKFFTWLNKNCATVGKKHSQTTDLSVKYGHDNRMTALAGLRRGEITKRTLYTST